MVVKHCAWGDCRSDNRYSHREYMKDVNFVKFPSKHSDITRCRKWVKACGRKNFTVDNVTRDTYICTKHFHGGSGPTTEYPDPLPCGITGPELRNYLYKSRRRRVPVHRTTPIVHVTQTPAQKQADEDQFEQQQLPPVFIDHSYVSTVEVEVETESCPTPKLPDENNNSGILSVEMAVQTDITLADLEGYTDQDLKGGSVSRSSFVNNITKDNASCKFYTGVTLATLMLVFNFIKSKAEKMRYWQGSARELPDPPRGNKRGPVRALSSFEEFLLTLVRVRRGLDVEVLADIFAVSCASVSRIFITWINLFQLELKFLVQWPSKEQVRQRLPKVFKCFPRTRAVIDCTEFFIQRPSLPSSQRVTWSSYKHHNTVKLLVAITPSGSFSFLSKLWTGSASDKKIVEESGFLDLVEYGDDVMADRGFLISGSLALRGATLNIPPFTNGKQLSSRATTKTRRIARARIHVERAIGELKTFKILQGVIPLKVKPYLDQIVLTCASLCNLNNRRVV